MYRLAGFGGYVIRESDRACIAPDPGNMDYVELIRSKVEIKPHVPEPEIPPEPTEVELLKSALLEAKVLTPEQLQKRTP